MLWSKPAISLPASCWKACLSPGAWAVDGRGALERACRAHRWPALPDCGVRGRPQVPASACRCAMVPGRGLRSLGLSLTAVGFKCLEGLHGEEGHDIVVVMAFNTAAGEQPCDCSNVGPIVVPTTRHLVLGPRHVPGARWHGRGVVLGLRNPALIWGCERGHDDHECADDGRAELGHTCVMMRIHCALLCYLG